MTPLSKQARIAGTLYLLDALAAPLRLVYIPNTLIVNGDAGATVGNIVAHERLFRLGILSDLFCGVIEIFLVLALYQLLRGVDRRRAVQMAILGLMTAPLFFVNVLNDSAALMLANGIHLTPDFTIPQLQALASIFLHLHRQEVLAAEIFYGLWLFPLALLVVRSGFLPRFLGVWLIANGAAYLILSFTGLCYPQYESLVSGLALPAQFGELVFLMWLLVMGAGSNSRDQEALV
jgi:hypothetical protein